MHYDDEAKAKCGEQFLNIVNFLTKRKIKWNKISKSHLKKMKDDLKWQLKCTDMDDPIIQGIFFPHKQMSKKIFLVQHQCLGPIIDGTYNNIPNVDIVRLTSSDRKNDYVYPKKKIDGRDLKVTVITKSGFCTVRYARWIDGRIVEWDIKNQQWKRYGQQIVMAIHSRAMETYSLISFYGITKVPETPKYMMVLEYVNDFGLSKLIEKNVENHQKINVFGVLPYIAPEVLSVLSGYEEYTKAADVYSFAII
ncbi:hypothetical protein Glove_276g53 [Diversispora epigaea]|uniref:Protein kinase domain-containing protein n=1 Tax=Diversispora epigaea TaxID=1348612 RepID=A0A397I6V0_9GLOM|nr:hypothetical protein Glove_276g53 [Diversispora epigaea]